MSNKLNVDAKEIESLIAGLLVKALCVQVGLNEWRTLDTFERNKLLREIKPHIEKYFSYGCI